MGVVGSDLGRGPPLLCSSFPAITPCWLLSAHKHMHEIWRLAKDVFPVGWLLSPPPVQRRCFEFQVVGLVYGELGTVSREVWESRNHQSWIHSSQSCLPLEPSSRRQRHFVATSIEDKKERNQTTEKKSSALCVDFEGRSAKGGSPARAGLLLHRPPGRDCVQDTKIHTPPRYTKEYTVHQLNGFNASRH